MEHQNPASLRVLMRGMPHDKKWEVLKPVLTEMFQNLPLKQIILQVRGTYGFDAKWVILFAPKLSPVADQRPAQRGSLSIPLQEVAMEKEHTFHCQGESPHQDSPTRQGGKAFTGAFRWSID
jgi:hypothetical protein